MMTKNIIINEQQLRASMKAIADQQRSLSALDDIGLIRRGIDPILIRAQRNSILALLSELEAKVSRYELARDRDPSALEVTSIDGLGEQLISARIGQGWSQKELAERLGVKEQQVQRYEKERYRMASLERVAFVARELGVQLKGKLKFQDTAENSKSHSLDEVLTQSLPSCFPLSEMKRRKWLPSHVNLRSDDDDLKRAALWDFFSHRGFAASTPMLNRRTERPQDEETKCALLTWQAQVKFLAHNRGAVPGRFRGLEPSFLKYLVGLSTQEEGPLKAIHALNDVGVMVVFEPHLPKTLLDGAAMLLDDNQPCIGMTLRQDRLDNFWFVLFHEIGHIVQHRNRGLHEGFLDEELEAGAADPREGEADEFARNTLISDEIWKSSFVRYARAKSQVTDFATSIGVGEEVVAGRLRHERQDFALFSDMVGRGKVRKMFAAAGMLEE